MQSLIEKIRHAVIGCGQIIETPMGEKPLVYADFTASGRSLDFIESYLREQVLPCYANTHTETSFSGAQTGALREEARRIIRQAVGAGENDSLIFCGSGATAAIDRMVQLLGMRLPAALDERYGLIAQIPAGERPVVFVGPYEHHSNELPWRESIADVVSVPLDARGGIDLRFLELALDEYAERPLRIASFSAASNVTGILSDVPAVTAVLKSRGALAFWDYAAAAPYVAIDMNGEQPLDAIFISPHKFVGGPGTPGVLLLKNHLAVSRVPVVAGGGTVSFVSPRGQCYVESVERREEAGTPAIIESIRAGMVFKLQQAVGIKEIERRERDLAHRAMERIGEMDNIEILGDRVAERLPVFSLRFRYGELDLHYGFIVSVLNDLFGIQARGGCSCAGPYAHSLLGLTEQHSMAIESLVQAGCSLLRPGWVRLSFNYFIGEEQFNYLLEALELVATRGWRLLSQYEYLEQHGVWRYQGESSRLPVCLAELDYMRLPEAAQGATAGPADYRALLKNAAQILQAVDTGRVFKPLQLPDTVEALRWFVLPQDATAAP